MALSEGELRAAALVMLLAYGAAGAIGVAPSLRKRGPAQPPVVERREIPRIVEACWLSVQGVTLLTLLAAIAFPSRVIDAPFSFLSSSSVVLTAVGAAVFLAGAALATASSRALGRQLTVAIEVRKGDELVSRGPYARVRHPLYTGVFLMTSGLALALAHPVLAALFLVALYCGNLRARTEEELLSSDAAHGQAYRAYQDRTGRFLPRVR